MVEPAAPVRVAAVQMSSGAVVEENLSTATDLLESARRAGASLAVLPENFAFMGRDDSERLAVSEESGDGPVQAWLAGTARALEMWIVGGTLPVRAPAGKVFSSCMVYSPGGRMAARYDKIHLFDVAVPGTGEHYRESACTEPGEQVVVCDSPVGRLGLAVCYDLRFPEQFRRMLSERVSAFALPAAFTATTGAAHWEVLVRARAVENLSPVIAAAQSGSHPGGRKTWGHTMVVDGWGRVLSQRETGPGIVLADLDMDAIARERESFPVLEHRRLSAGPSGSEAR